MADDTTRIINLTEATEVSDGMYLVTDASTGTRKLSLQKVLDKVGGNVADEYDSTATYDVGDLCVYKGVLYECTTAISTAEAWNSAHWSRINLGDIVADIDGSIEELYEDKANESGEYDNIVAGTAKQLLSSIYTTNDSPYIYRPTPADSDRERVKRIEGLSVGWNQLCNGSSVTVTSGHKYYMKKASVESIGASDGTALTGLTSGTDMVIDLTLLFGSATIADHIYTLEQATEGSGVAWVKQYIDLDTYHAYSAPTIKSVEGLESHDMVGKNQVPFPYSYGTKTTDGITFTVNSDGSIALTGTATATVYFDIGKATENLMHLPKGTYTMKKSGNSGVVITLAKSVNGVGQFVDAVNTTDKTISLTGGYYYYYMTVNNGTTVNTIVYPQLEIGSVSTDYEPYEKHSYPLDSTLTLRGVPKLVDGQLVADGDYYPPDGVVSERYKETQLSSSPVMEVTTEYTNIVYAKIQAFSDAKKTIDKNAMLEKYGQAINIYPFDDASAIGKVVTNANANQWWVGFPVGTTLAQATEALAGLAIVYELTTPTTSTALPYAEVEICDGNGTEEFVTDSPVPVGHVTEYTADLRKQVENIYGIPPVPEEDGEYTLHATVAEGVKTFTWESES